MTLLKTLGRWSTVLAMGSMLAACGGSQEAEQATKNKMEAAAQEAKAMADERVTTERWNALSTEIPTIIETVTERVDQLAKEPTKPETFAETKTVVDKMNESWQQALGAFANNNMKEAVDMAQVAKDKGVEAMNTLGLHPAS
jgi:hypothetical protein